MVKIGLEKIKFAHSGEKKKINKFGLPLSEHRRTEVRVLKGLLGRVSLRGMQVSLGALTQTMRFPTVCVLPPRLLGTVAANSPARFLRVLGNDLSARRGTP